jgi:hypothetical protein
MKLRFLLGLIFIAGLPRAIDAQSANSNTEAELIKTLTARIEQLERRVAELEGPAKTIPATAQPTEPKTIPQASGEAMHANMQRPPAAAENPDSDPSLKIAGFSDFNFGATDQPGARSGFTEGQFILHLNSRLSPRVSYLGELSLTARPDAGTGAPAVTGFNAEVERSIVRFEYNDYAKLSFGRYHTPINYWNTAYHHGAWLQTPISRPEMIQFGGRFIPVHFIGGLLEGAVPAGGLNLNYSAGIGNGRGGVVSRAGDAGDINNNRAWLVNLFARPDALYGLQVGGSAYRDKISLVDGRDFREWITSAHAVWSKEDPEVIAEYANVHHQQINGPAVPSNSGAFYVQAGYRLPLFERLWKPYYRFEYIHVPRSDVVFQLQPVSNLAGSVVGLRYDLSSFAAMKFEYRNQRRAPGQPRINGVFFQTSFAF